MSVPPDKEEDCAEASGEGQSTTFQPEADPWHVPGVEARPGEVLIDEDYHALAACDLLVKRGGGDPELSYEQAALDVHMSDEVRKLVNDEVGGLRKLDFDDGHIIIRPGDLVVVGTQERFRVPHDVQGQVSPKAKLTTVGLLFPTTHVDPGYTGPLYLPIFNAGPSTVRLPLALAIGKVEFQRLGRKVRIPWTGKSSFSTVDSELIVPGRSGPAERQERLRKDLRRLTLWWLLLSVVVLAMLLSGPVSDALEDLDWDFFTKEGVKAYVAPVVVAVVVAAMLYVIGVGVQNARGWFRKLPGASEPDDTS
jgi:deoxycytidine triphosphate deaminase